MNSTAPHVLIVTATPVETKALHQVIKPLHDKGTIEAIPLGNNTYFKGGLGGYVIVHVQCRMGAGNDGGAIVTVQEALGHWPVKAVIMVGIAFGIDPKNQQIGDVLISNNIVPYENARVGELESIARGGTLPSGPKLRNRFENAVGWNHGLPDGGTSKVSCVDLLSGEKLVDNLTFRQELQQRFPTTKGGEMEGAGVFVAARSRGLLEMIIVKAICDFADGNKGENKQTNQQVAAEAAVALCQHVLSQPECLSALGCALAPAHQVIDEEIAKKALFWIYSNDSKDYYLERSLDASVFDVMRLHHVWVWGESGVGKTSALLHNAGKMGVDVKFVDLSTSVGLSIQDTLKDVYTSLRDIFSVSEKAISFGKSVTVTELTNAIIQVLQSKVQVQTIVLFDEYPATTQEQSKLFVEFAEKLTLRLTNSQSAPLLKLGFASLESPRVGASIIREKLNDRMTILKLEQWSETDLRLLATMLNDALYLRLENTHLDEIVKWARGSPRRTKTALRRIYQSTARDSIRLRAILNQIDQD